MDAFEPGEVAAIRSAAGKRYPDVLRGPALRAGLYLPEAGDTDPQQPHREDELYLVVAGQATITVGDEQRPVGPGSLVFVAGGVPHRFHDITERLEVLVVFGPAESLPGE